MLLFFMKQKIYVFGIVIMSLVAMLIWASPLVALARFYPTSISKSEGFRSWYYAAIIDIGTVHYDPPPDFSPTREDYENLQEQFKREFPEYNIHILDPQEQETPRVMVLREYDTPPFSETNEKKLGTMVRTWHETIMK